MTLTRRVEDLVAATREMATGNLAVQTRLTGSDEIASLGESFNRMANELQDRTVALRASEERFHTFLRQSPMVAWVKDDSLRFRYVNPAYEKLFARSAAEIVGQTDFDILPAAARENRAQDQRVADTGKSLEVVEVVAGADGRPRHWLVQKFPLPQPGRAPWVGGTAIDITARIEAENVLRRVLAGTGPELGQDFFRSLVEHLAGALQVKYAFVGELTGPNRDRVRILSLWADGQPAEPVEYSLKGTPCEQVLDRRQCLFSQSAQQQFPDDALLREMGVESYLGVPLHDRAGKPLGLLAVLHDRPLPDLEINRLMLSIFGSRAGAELERLRAEETLRVSEARLHAIVHRTPHVAVQGFDLEGRVQLWNEASARMFGWSAEEALGRTLDQLIYTPEEAAAFRQSLRNLAGTGRSLGQVEFSFHRRNGEAAQCLGTLFEVPGLAGQPMVVCMKVDVTERNRAEGRLRQSHEQFQTLFRASPLPGVLFSLETAVFVDVNDRFTAASGFSREEVVGRSGQDLGLWCDLADRDRLLGALRRHEELRDCEVRLRTKDGRMLDMLLSAQLIDLPVGPVVMVQAVDLTERKRAQEALRNSQEMIAAIIHAIPVRVFWKDRKLCYLGCNAAFAQDAGFAAPADLIGKNDYQMGWHAQAELYRADDRRIIEEDTTRLHIEEPMTLSNGRTITLLTSKTPLRNAAGEITGVLGTYLDITARKEAEAARTHLETQLRQAQKMEAIGTLAGGIAHDFNNILGVILSNAHLAALDTASGHPAAESLAEIAAAGQRAKALVEQILAFSRQQPTHQRVVEAPAIVAEVTRFLKASLPASVELVTALEPGCPPIVADATQVHQILVNLVTNAWHALGDHVGRISLGLRPVQLPAEALSAASDLPAGIYVCFTVTDTGSGMESATLKRIFDPFFTTKPPGQGTGLGLSVVHGIVQQHHGAIHVESQPGVGSTFTVYLPAAAPVAAPTPTPANPPASPPIASLRVLVLDDEEALLQVSRRLLTRLGHQVEGFGQPAAALTRFHEDPSAFDLIITDFNMPGQSGLAIAAEMLRLRPGLPILLTSGKVTDDLRRRAQELGIREVLNKPVALHDLTAAVQREAAHRGS
jgi:PAS domain S-box-containing protein